MAPQIQKSRPELVTTRPDGMRMVNIGQVAKEMLESTRGPLPVS